jgi:hypothetical protein
MFIHIFAFRWQPGTTDAQKEKVAAAIRALQGKIPQLIETHVGTNVSPRGKDYGFGGVMTFASKADFEAYNLHPEHQALLGWLLPLIDALEIDFAG